MGSILALGAAPAIIRSGILMPVRQIVIPRVITFEGALELVRHQKLTPQFWVGVEITGQTSGIEHYKSPYQLSHTELQLPHSYEISPTHRPKA